LNLGVNPSTEADVDSSRLRTGEIVAGIGGLAMFIFLFFDWFSGAPELSGNLVTGATISRPGVSGWDALIDLPGFLIILSAVSGIALVYLAAAGQRVNIPVQRGAVTAALGSLAVLLILWRMFAGSPTLKIGVFLGLAAAVAITAGALMALAEDGFSPLLAVAGGRTRAMSSSAEAPTATQPAAEQPAPADAEASGDGTSTSKPASRSGGSRGRSASSRSGGSRSKSSSSTRAKSSGSRSSSSRSGSSSRSSGSRSSGTRKRSSGGSK
jgi:hypothetical protein